MDYDQDKVDDMTLALLWLVMWKDRDVARAWKGFDWDTMHRLHEKGFIGDPKGKAKSPYQNESAFAWLISPLDCVRLHRPSSEGLLRLPCQRQKHSRSVQRSF